MFKRLMPLLAAFFLSCLSFGYVDWTLVGKGRFVSPAEVPLWTMDQAKAFKQAGYGHAAILLQATPKNDGSAVWPSLISDADLVKAERFYHINRLNSLRTVIKVTGWATEHQRALEYYARGQEPTFFTQFPVQLAREVKKWAAKDWVAIEVGSELNWNVANVNKALQPLTPPDQIWTPLTHDQARQKAIPFADRFYDTVIPKMVEACPQLSIVLGGIAYASAHSTIEWTGWNVSRFARLKVRMALHFYEPFWLSHAGGSNTPPFVWPDPNGLWKALVPDPLSSAYGMQYHPATRAGLLNFVKLKRDWFAAQGVPVYAGEYGVRSGALGQPFATAYLLDVESVLDELGIPRCRFVWN